MRNMLLSVACLLALALAAGCGGGRSGTTSSSNTSTGGSSFAKAVGGGPLASGKAQPIPAAQQGQRAEMKYETLPRTTMNRQPMDRMVPKSPQSQK